MWEYKESTKEENHEKSKTSVQILNGTSELEYLDSMNLALEFLLCRKNKRN